jgi:hypothetical protein
LTNRKIASSNGVSRKRSMMRLSLIRNDTHNPISAAFGVHADIGAHRLPTTSTQKEVSNVGAVVLASARPL